MVFEFRRVPTFSISGNSNYRNLYFVDTDRGKLKLEGPTVSWRIGLASRVLMRNLNLARVFFSQFPTRLRLVFIRTFTPFDF